MEMAVSEEQFGRDMLAAAQGAGHVAKMPPSMGALAVGNLSCLERRVERWIGEQPISFHEVSSAFSISPRHAGNVLRTLFDRGYLQKSGKAKGPSGWYVTTFKRLEAA